MHVCHPGTLPTIRVMHPPRPSTARSSPGPPREPRPCVGEPGQDSLFLDMSRPRRAVPRAPWLRRDTERGMSGPRSAGTRSCRWLDGPQHHLVTTYPAGQPAGDGQRAVVVWGPRAGRSLAAPVGQASAHAASSSPALPGSSRRFAARGTAADGHGAHRRHGGGPRLDQRSEPRPATPADAPFSWFGVDHDGGDLSSG
jgi:hypothetical protein